MLLFFAVFLFLFFEMLFPLVLSTILSFELVNDDIVEFDFLFSFEPETMTFFVFVMLFVLILF